MAIELSVKLDELANATLCRVRRNSIPRQAWNVKGVMKQIEKFGKSLDPRFVIDEDNGYVYESIALWLMGDPAFMCVDPISGRMRKGRIDKGLYIAGNVGSGKTTAMRIVNKFYAVNPFRLVSKCFAWKTINANLVAGAFERDGDRAILSTLHEELLCIEDLGAEDKDAMFMGNRRNVFRKILEYRGDELNEATMVTSNIPLGHPDFAQMYGERAQSRCIEMMNYLVLKGDDRRRR